MRVITLSLFFLMASLSTAEMVEKHFHYHFASPVRSLGDRKRKRKKKRIRAAKRKRYQINHNCVIECEKDKDKKACEDKCFYRDLWKYVQYRFTNCEGHYCKDKSGDALQKCKDKCKNYPARVYYMFERKACYNQLHKTWPGNRNEAFKKYLAYCNNIGKISPEDQKKADAEMKKLVEEEEGKKNAPKKEEPKKEEPKKAAPAKKVRIARYIRKQNGRIWWSCRRRCKRVPQKRRGRCQRFCFRRGLRRLRRIRNRRCRRSRCRRVRGKENKANCRKKCWRKADQNSFYLVRNRCAKRCGRRKNWNDEKKNRCKARCSVIGRRKPWMRNKAKCEEHCKSKEGWWRRVTGSNTSSVENCLLLCPKKRLRRLVGRCLSGCAQIRVREQRRLCAVGCRGLE